MLMFLAGALTLVLVAGLALAVWTAQLTSDYLRVVRPAMTEDERNAEVMRTLHGGLGSAG